MIFEIAMIILVVYYFSKDPSHVKDWERQFIEQHERKGNRTIKHNFDSTNTALLIKLCKKKVRKKELIKRTPEEETHFIAFKKHKHPPFRVKMIRCKDTFSVIDAPGHHCAYVLLKGKRNKYVKGTMFYIKEKFCYHPPHSHHSALKGLDQDQYQDNEHNYYEEREYRAKEHPHGPIHDQYAARSYQPYDSFPYDQRKMLSDYYPTYDTYERFHGHQMNPGTEYAYYNQRPQFDDEYYPRSNEYENRELRDVRSDPNLLMESHQQDARNPLGAYTDHSSAGHRKEEIKPSYNMEGYSPRHRPELQHVRSDPTLLMDSHQQDTRKPSGAYMDHSSAGHRREEMKPPHAMEGYSPTHRATHFTDINHRYSYNMDRPSNHLPRNNMKTSLNDTLYSSVPRHQPSKMDKPSELVGPTGTVVTRKEYPSETARTYAADSYTRNPPPLNYSRNNDWPLAYYGTKYADSYQKNPPPLYYSRDINRPLPYYGTKYTESRIPGRELSRNPYSNHYDLTHRDAHGPRSLGQHKPRQHEEMNPRSTKRSPSLRKLDFSDKVRQPNSDSHEKDRHRISTKNHSSPSDEADKTNLYRTASYEYKPTYAPRGENYGQALHSANTDRQPLEDYRYNKSEKYEPSSAAVDPYTLTDTNLARRSSVKTSSTYDTRTIGDSLSHHPSVSTAPYHGPKSILEGGNPPAIPATVYDHASYHSSLRGNPPSSGFKEELHDNYYPLLNEKVAVNSVTSCDVCGNEHVPTTDGGPPPHDDDHLLQETLPPANQLNESTMLIPNGTKNPSSLPHSLAHQTPAKKTIFEEHREREEMSACDDWCSQQSSSTEYTKAPKRIIMTNENYSRSNYPPSNRNAATKRVQKTEPYSEQQRRHNYQDTRVRKPVSYPFYGLKNLQESEDEQERLNHYKGVVRLKERSYSSPNRLEKLPSSYLSSHPDAQQTLEPTEPKREGNSEDDVFNVSSFPTQLRDAKQSRSFHETQHTSFYGQPRRTYPLKKYWSSVTDNSSLSNGDVGMRSHPHALRPEKYQKSPMQPFRPFQNSNLSTRTAHLDDEGSTLISSPNESLLARHLSLPETDNYSRYGKKTDSAQLWQRSVNNSSNISRYQAPLGENDLSEQSKGDIPWSGPEELELNVSKPKLGRSYTNDGFSKKKHGTLHKKFSNDTLFKGNSGRRYKVTKEIEEESEEVQSFTTENVSPPESQYTERKRDNKPVYFSAKNKGALARNHSARNTARCIQSSTPDQLSSAESLDDVIQRASSEYLLNKKQDAKGKKSYKNGKRSVSSDVPDFSCLLDTEDSLASEIEDTSQSNKKEGKRIKSSTLRNPSLPESQDNNKKMTRSKDFMTTDKGMELKSKKVQNEEKYDSSTSDGENSHGNMDNDIRTIRSGYSATKDQETKAKKRVDQSKERRVRLEFSTSDDESIPESQRTTVKTTVKNFKTKSKDLETRTESRENKEGSVHLRPTDDPGSPITIRRSTLEDAKNAKIKVKGRSNSKEEVQSSIPDDASSADSQYSDIKATRSTYLLTKN